MLGDVPVDGSPTGRFSRWFFRNSIRYVERVAKGPFNFESELWSGVETEKWTGNWARKSVSLFAMSRPGAFLFNAKTLQALGINPVAAQQRGYPLNGLLGQRPCTRLVRAKCPKGLPPQDTSHSETIAVVSKRRGNQKGKLQTQAASKFGYERQRTKRRRSATLPLATSPAISGNTNNIAAKRGPFVSTCQPWCSADSPFSRYYTRPRKRRDTPAVGAEPH
jgi:hypothetical protein